jgi:hypothetical protein
VTGVGVDVNVGVAVGIVTVVVIVAVTKNVAVTVGRGDGEGAVPEDGDGTRIIKACVGVLVGTWVCDPELHPASINAVRRTNGRMKRLISRLDHPPQSPHQ